MFPWASLQSIVVLRRPYSDGRDAFDATAAVQINYHKLVCTGRGRDQASSTYHIGRSEVVEERRNTLLTLCRYRNVQDPLAAVIGLLKRQITNVGPDTLLQDSDIKKVTLLREAADPPKQGLPSRMERRDVAVLGPALGRKRRQVDAIAAQDGGELVLGVDGDEGGDQGACSGASDDAREQAAQEQGLDDAQVAHAEYGAALQHQRAPPKGLPRVMDAVQLHLRRQRRSSPMDGRRASREGADVLDRLGDLRNVFIDKVFRAGKRSVIEFGRGDVAQVSHETGS